MKFPKLLKNTAIYSFVTLLQKGISFFLLPLYTYYLKPADYGVLSIVTSISSLLSIFILLGLNGAAARFYYKKANDIAYTKSLWGTLTSIVMINSFLIITIVVVFHKYIIDPIIGDIDFYPYILLGLLNTLLNPLYLFFQTYLQTRQDGVRYGVNTFLNFVLNTLLIIFFLVVLKQGVLGVLLANVITAVVFFIYVICTYIPRIKIGVNRSILKNSLHYSLPLLPHSLAAWSNGMIDKLFLNGLSSKYNTGLYGVGQQFGGLVGVVANSANQAFTPWFFEKIEKQGEKELVKKVGQMLIAFYCIVAFFISAYSPEILRVMVAQEYFEVWKIIPLLSFGCVFQGVYFLYVNNLFLNKTGRVFIVTLFSALVNIVLNILLIPKLGIYGASIAFFVTLLCQSFCSVLLSRKEKNGVSYGIFKIYSVILLCFLLTGVNFFLPQDSFILGLFIKSFILILIVMVFYFKYKDTISDFLVKSKNEHN